MNPQKSTPYTSEPNSQTSDQNSSSNEKRDISTYLNDFQDAYRYVRTAYHPLWYDCYRTYNNKRVNIGYAGVNDAFIPETFTIIESLVANIAGGDPRFQFVPTNEEQKNDTEVLSQMTDYYWEANHMRIKAQQWVRDSLIYGNGILHVTWDYIHQMPHVANVPLRDFFVDPAATTMENARYAGFRYLADKDKLKTMRVIDPDTGELVPKYHNLDELENESKPANGEPLDKQKKEQMIGSTLGSQNTRQVEVILMYYMDTKKVCEIANRSTVIREVDTPFMAPEKTQNVPVLFNGVTQMVKKKIDPIDPFLPFAILRDYVDSSLFFARGEVEVIMPRQETLNDVENMDLDNMSYTNNVMWQIDPQYADMVPEIESIPGAVYPLPKGALSVIERPVMSQDLGVKKQEIKDEMRRATAADEVIQGVSQNQGRITATEVSSTLTQAQTRFSTKLANLESEGYAQLAAIMFKMTQLFVDQEQAIRIVGPQGIHFKDYDPWEYSGYFEPHVKLDSTIKKLDLEQGQKLNQMYQVILGNANVNQQEALRYVLSKLGAEDEEIQKMLNVPQAGPQPKVTVSLKGDITPFQEQELASTQGFGGEKVAAAAQADGMPMPGEGMDPNNPLLQTSNGNAMMGANGTGDPAATAPEPALAGAGG